MSLFKNLLGNFVPVREQRRFTSVTLNALNAELVATINGDAIALVDLRAVAAASLTVAFEASIDGVNYFAVNAYPMAAAVGTIGNLAQPIQTEAFAAVIPVRQYVIPCAGFQLVRVRISAYTSGAIASAAINTDPSPLSPVRYFDDPPSTLGGTATGAAAAAVTLTLPAVAGFRHILTGLSITRSASALLVAAAAPVVVTTTNIPGALAFTFGADAAAQGTDKVVTLQPSSSGLACTAINTATTIVCPATTGVIWRVYATYRLGY